MLIKVKSKKNKRNNSLDVWFEILDQEVMNILIVPCMDFISYMCTYLFTEKPAQPSELKYSIVRRDTVQLDWKAPSHDGGHPITHYIIESKEETDYERSDWRKIKTIPSASTSYIVPDLKPGRRYSFRVFAQNPAGFSRALDFDEPISPEGPAGKLSYL